MKTVIIVLILVAIVVGIRLFTPRLGSVVASGVSDTDGIAKLGDCPTTPNCQGSESSRSEQRVDRFAIEHAADNAIDTLATLITSFPGAAIVQQSERYIHATFTSRWMGYVDDVEFLLSDDRQGVQVRSASRLGKLDLGANEARIKMLRAASNGKL